MENRFKFIFTVDDVAEYLDEVCHAYIEKRGRTFQKTESYENGIRAAAKWLTDDSCKPGLLLYGSQPGTGKTTIASGLYEAIQGYPDNVYWSIVSPINEDADLRINEIAPWEYGVVWSCGERSYWNDHNPEKYAQILKIDDERDKKIADIDKVRQRAKHITTPSAGFYTAQEIADGAERTGHDYLDSLRDIGILFIDDLGVEPISVNNYGTQILPLVELLTFRYAKSLPVVLTSNLSDNELSKRYGLRVADRFNEFCDRVHFKGQSLRG